MSLGPGSSRCLGGLFLLSIMDSGEGRGLLAVPLLSSRM